MSSMSHDPSKYDSFNHSNADLMLKETFLIIINVEHSCAT